MSFFDDASLAFLPSGAAGKDGKAYSIKPTDGTGDFTFSRGSNLAATRVGADGLIEKGRENLLLQSNQFDTTWAGNNALAISGYADRNGGTNAWLLREQAGNIQHYIRQSSGLYSGIGTFSFYAKKKDYDWIQFARSGDGGDYANFNISNGTLGNVSGASIIDRKIESVGNGWYRCSVTYSFGSNSFVGIALIRSDVSSRYEVYQGDNTSGTYIQDAQVEQGLVASDVISTTTTSVSAGILEDMPRLDYSGGASCPSLLLEPQRTNLVAQSEYFNSYSKVTSDATSVPVVTDNYAISPEGLQNAARVVVTKPSTDNDYAFIREAKSIAKTSGDKMSQSVYLKATDASQIGKIVDIYAYDGSYLSVKNHTLTSEWERVEAIHTASVGTSNTEIVIGKARAFAGGTTLANMATDFLVYGHQFENGSSYPTSYIPTYGTSQTRSGEATLTDANTFDSLSSFTWFFEILRIGFSGDMSSSALSLRTTSGAEQIRCHFDAPSQQIRIRDAINGYTTIGASLPVTAGTYIKICVVSDGETIKTFANGSQRGGDYTIVTQHDVERVYMNEKGFNCKQLLVFPTALTDSECIALTTL